MMMILSSLSPHQHHDSRDQSIPSIDGICQNGSNDPIQRENATHIVVSSPTVIAVVASSMAAPIVVTVRIVVGVLLGSIMIVVAAVLTLLSVLLIGSIIVRIVSVRSSSTVESKEIFESKSSSKCNVQDN